MFEFLKRYRWPILGAGVLALVVGFLLFRPDKLFVDDVVDESLEDAFTAGAPAAADGEPTTTTTTTVPSTTTTTAPPSDPDDGASPTTTTTATTTTVPESTGPVAVTSGGWFGIDHDAGGTATIYEQDGAFVLRFEDDTDIQNGPDLHVWLLERDTYEDGAPGPHIYLGTLKGNVGGQNYTLPAEFSADVHRFVLIWCERFNVPFAGAPLS